MTVLATVVNKAGNTVYMDKPCFGFMSYIHLWDESDCDDEDWDDDDDYEEPEQYPLADFESTDLASLIYHAKPFQHMNMPAADCLLAYNGVLDAVQKLPRWYGDVKFEPKGEAEKGNYQMDITFPLPDHQMQLTILGGMMLRNIFCYTSTFQSFLYCLKNGVAPEVAFVIAQAMFRSVGFSGSYFYRSADGDESVFGSHARICDLKAMLNGVDGDLWQGNWGDTVDGYGRYGCYNNDETGAPTSRRTRQSKDLRDATLIADAAVYDESPRIAEALAAYQGQYGFSDAAIPALVALITE